MLATCMIPLDFFMLQITLTPQAVLGPSDSDGIYRIDSVEF
jgi:hypothetical protein